MLDDVACGEGGDVKKNSRIRDAHNTSRAWAVLKLSVPVHGATEGDPLAKLFIGLEQALAVLILCRNRVEAGHVPRTRRTDIPNRLTHEHVDCASL